MPDATQAPIEAVEYDCMTTVDDYMAATNLVLRRGVLFWMMAVALTLVCGHGAYKAIASLVGEAGETRHVISLAIFVGLYLGWLWMVFRQPRRRFRDFPYIGVAFHMTVNDNGIFGSSEKISYGSYWPTYTGAVERQDHFFLAVGPEAAQPFPKRCMTADGVARFRALVRAHVANARLLE